MRPLVGVYIHGRGSISAGYGSVLNTTKHIKILQVLKGGACLGGPLHVIWHICESQNQIIHQLLVWPNTIINITGGQNININFCSVIWEFKYRNTSKAHDEEDSVVIASCIMVKVTKYLKQFRCYKEYQFNMATQLHGYGAHIDPSNGSCLSPQQLAIIVMRSFPFVICNTGRFMASHFTRTCLFWLWLW